MIKQMANFNVIGEYQDKIIHQDGRVEFREGHNIVVNNFSKIVAALLKKDASYNSDIYWAIGEGEDTWEGAPSYEMINFAVTKGCTASGNISITLNGTVFTVAVTNGWTAAQVATAILNKVFTGWTTSAVNSTTTKLTANVSEPKTDPVTNMGATGVTMTVTVTQQGNYPATRPAALVTDAGCVSEIARKVVDSIFYKDGETTVSTPTNVLEISCTFNDTDAVGSWREFCLFAGNATTALNSGLAINHKIHDLISKSGTMTVERKIRFTITQGE